jgi:hypothetical protein
MTAEAGGRNVDRMQQLSLAKIPIIHQVNQIGWVAKLGTRCVKLVSCDFATLNWPLSMA